MNADPILYLWITAVLGLGGIALFRHGDRCRETGRGWIWITLAIALGARAFAFVMVEASDDVNRYVWEGKIVASGRSPYLAPAIDPIWQEDRDAWWQGMNHLEDTSVYPPLTQLAGALLVRLSESAGIFKLSALLGDLLLLVLLWRIWGHRARSLRWIAALWGLNPVPVISFAGEGHFDSWMIFFAVAALAAAQRSRWRLSWVMLATAIAIKWIALLMLPLWLWRSRGKGSWTALPVLLLPALPFLSTLDELFHAFLHFGTAFGSNNPLHYALTALTGSRRSASLLSALLLAVWVAAVGWRHRRSMALQQPTFELWCGLLLCLPTVTYWYAAWILPWAALSRSWPWWMLSLSAVAYYAAAWQAQQSGGTWSHPPWAVALTWLPLYGALILSALRRPRSVSTDNSAC